MISEKNCRHGVWCFASEMVPPKSTRAPGRAGLPMAQSGREDSGRPSGCGDQHRGSPPPSGSFGCTDEILSCRHVAAFLPPHIPTFCTFPPFELFLGYRSGIATRQHWPSIRWKTFVNKVSQMLRESCTEFNCQIQPCFISDMLSARCKFKAAEIATWHQ